VEEERVSERESLEKEKERKEEANLVFNTASALKL
jgi:predicted nucleic acid-binding Zn ribbon protein